MITSEDLKEKLEKRFGPLTFGSFIQSMRALMDLTQTEMAAKLGFSKSTLCDIEKGRQLVSVELAAKIARKCNFPEAPVIEAAIQDQLRKAKLKYKVKIVA